MQEKRKSETNSGGKKAAGNSKIFSVRLSQDLYDRLENASWDNRIRKNQIIILSIENYLHFIEKRNIKEPKN